MEKKLSFATKSGCKKLMAIFLVLIIAFSFVARLISSDCGKVKISHVTFDSRGAIIDADLYYPSGTSDEDKLPAVVVAHGGGVEKGVVRGTAEELARRGYVVLNVNAYGVSLSEQPEYDENDQGILGYNNQQSPCGVLDALNFLRTLNFVDQERIGMTGHSMGSRRTAFACMMDCGFMSLNDTMINVLSEQFGQKIKESEINEDADKLAEKLLNADQLEYYKAIKAEKQEKFNTSIKALCLMGSNANTITPMQEVSVAGYTVLRNCQVNIGIVDGQFDYSYRAYPTLDTTKESWHTGTDDIAFDTWYIIDDASATSKTNGTIYTMSTDTNQTLSDAIDAKTTRLFFTLNKETHSKNFFSPDTTGDICKYFEQTLKYNGGELGSADAKPVNNVVFVWREIFNLLAMLSMFAFIIAVGALLIKTDYFAGCVAAEKEVTIPTSKKSKCIFGIVGVAVAFISIYLANKVFVPGLPNLPFLPFFPSWWLTFIYIGIVGAFSGAILIIRRFMDKSKEGIKALNFGLSFKNILKTVLLGAILLAVGYATLALVEYLFHEDFRFWMAVFTEMKAEYWRFVWRYTLCMLPLFLLIGGATNYGKTKADSGWKDMLITIVINSLGVWLCCAVNYMMLVGADTLWSSFISTYGMLLIVPITVYITRKCYQLTNSVWLGALVNAFFISWCFCSSIGLNCNVYNPQYFLSNFLNA